MKCASCNNHFKDGVFCNGCKRTYLDFACALRTEAYYRKLDPDRRVHWRCPQCKSASPKPAAPDQPTLNTVLLELREQKVLLNRFPELVKSVKNEMMELKLACEFNMNIDKFESRITTVEN